MSAIGLKVLQAGPYICVQDEGRPGWLRFGVSQGGAMDLLALEEGRLLVGNERGLAALEMLAIGGRFEVFGGAITMALTGAHFSAKIGERALQPYMSFSLKPGEVLEVGALLSGNYGYLSFAGGIDTPLVLGSRSTHIRAGFGGLDGRCVKLGDVLPIGLNPNGDVDLQLPHAKFSSNQDVRVLWGAQAGLFSDEQLQRFANSQFEVSFELDRMGVKLTSDTPPLHAKKGLVTLSGAIALGDIQITGDGQPVVLLTDRQPTGGYPRIATIIGADIAQFAQCPPGAKVRFKPVGEGEAIKALQERQDRFNKCPEQLVQNHGNPYASHRLLSQNLISGVVGKCEHSSDEDQGS